jgi:hypothetical protein
MACSLRRHQTLARMLMPKRAINRIRQVTALIVLLGTASPAATQSTSAIERDFPIATVDYFAAMDDGIHLDSHGVRGRNTWLLWTAGDEAFWDLLATQSSGTFDLLKVLDSRNRSTRFSYYGVMNEPGFKQASAADQYGLWLDAPDGTHDPYYAARYDEAFPKDAFLRTYGRASGVVGLRIFPNPNFDAAARRQWNPQRFYDDPAYYSDPKLVRPYSIGMACGFCHVGPHPLHPPAKPERPDWENLSSNIGAQYLKPARVFVLPHQESNFLFQVVNSMPPGTVDTSALATDNINNPRAMNALYNVSTRLKIAAEESLAGGNLDLPGTQKTMPVPHVLKDGADSVGVIGALARVYISIGSFHQEWLKHFNLLVGGKRETPIAVAVARRNSPYFRATLTRLADVAAFFVAAAKPQPLAKAPSGADYLQDSDATVARGQQLFAENCAGCHVSYNKMPEPPPGVERATPAWDAWVRSDDFMRKMTELVRRPDFLDDNFLSTDRRYPVTRIGTNACSALASNALRGHVWDNFSSETYKNLPAVGTIEVNEPISGDRTNYVMPGGGRGYVRVPSLVSIWASAPYLQNNSVGKFTGDPSVAGRMEAFQDGIEKLLWPEKRLGFASVYRTTEASWLKLSKSSLPAVLLPVLERNGLLTSDGQVAVLGPIPKGTPINLLANISLLSEGAAIEDQTAHAEKLLVALAELNEALKASPQGATFDQAADDFRKAVTDLLAVSNCPDSVTDRGHLFGTRLPDDDKRALITFLKRI